jgi:pimeloyl-ACP methyl ester carboxylesterase
MAQKMWQAVPDVDAMLQIMLHSPEVYSMQEAMKSTQAETIVQIHLDNIIKSLEWKNFEQEKPIPNTTERLSELKIPVLFIIGTEDKKDLFKIKKLFAAVQNIQFRTVAGADHAIVMFHPDIILDEFKRFLQ